MGGGWGPPPLKTLSSVQVMLFSPVLGSVTPVIGLGEIVGVCFCQTI